MTPRTKWTITLVSIVVVLGAATAVVAVAISNQPTTSTSPPAETFDPALPGPVSPVARPTEIATGLEAPWSILRLESGSTLISERDSGTIVELTADGEQRDVGTVEGVVHVGEGGLLGLATQPGDESAVFVYLTAASDNRIVRIELTGAAGSYALGESSDILTGLEKASNHDGGRIAFGPDGMLYATVGDASNRESSQDLDSLNGKILRMSPTGSAPDDNPFPDSLVYSYGHRNPQGIAWDDNGQLFAAEFGQNTWDEFNRIDAGGNYGWPEVEGIADGDEFIDPLLQWATDDASPSGLAYVRGTFFMASLKGERIWAIYTDDEGGAGTFAWFEGEYGRIRDVTAGPDGTLWFLTNNTDGRGSPAADDDRLIQSSLGELVEG